MERIPLGDCEIHIGRGLDVPELLPEREDRRTAAVLTQSGAVHLAEKIAEGLRRSGLAAEVLPIDGKDLDAAERAYGWLRRLQLTRRDTIVAVGGGAITDLAGFVAATYLRGVEAVYVPTTLLGAVDAAIGGKTGLDFGAKNLIGTFTLPTLVVIDLDPLEHISTSLWEDGAAEAVKTALIADRTLLEAIEAEGRSIPLEVMVGRSVAAKVSVVANDFQEMSQRAVLNYGHTVGHAVEVATGSSHGRAVAVGMEAASRVSADEVGFADGKRQTEALASLGLPVTAAGDRDRVLDLIGLDKKRSATGTRMVLLRGIADPVVADVEDATVRAAVEFVLEPN